MNPILVRNDLLMETCQFFLPSSFLFFSLLCKIIADVDGDDVELPAVVQEELAATFQAERESLQSRLHALQAEIEQSQHAFDTYRERAKQSLLKSAAEQKASEVALAAANEQLQVRHTCLFDFDCGILTCLCIFGCIFTFF